VDAANGAPLPGVLLYVFHTDATGHYTKRGDEQGVQRWQGHLHGWLRTGADGRYAVRTIRPAPYPDGSMPAHIHAALQLPDGRACWVNDFVFADDPMVTDGYLTGLNNPGNPKDRDNGVVGLTEQEDMHIGARDIVVDRNAVVH
jgi:protocatechuate 3,4-dioxygenase beta subunit